MDLKALKEIALMELNMPKLSVAREKGIFESTFNELCVIALLYRIEDLEEDNESLRAYRDYERAGR